MFNFALTDQPFVTLSSLAPARNIIRESREFAWSTDDRAPFFLAICFCTLDRDLGIMMYDV
jgi:hypothetical protein